MYQLYFESPLKIGTLFLTLGLGAFIIVSLVQRQSVERWGWRILVLAALGLWLCCLAATRDGYHLTVQNAIDGSVAAGLFGLKSLQSTLCCICGGVIFLGGLSAIFVHNQTYRFGMFTVLSIAFMTKVLTIEVSRIILTLQR